MSPSGDAGMTGLSGDHIPLKAKFLHCVGNDSDLATANMADPCAQVASRM